MRITNQGLQGFHESRATAFKVFYESRDTNHGFFSRGANGARGY